MQLPALASLVLRAFPDRVGRQLGAPSGILGHLVARRLNENNRGEITAAVEALELIGGERVADIGYGGGLGLRLLLDHTGPQGRVEGLDPSPSMIDRAARQFAEEVAAGSLLLHRTTMDDLPWETGSLDCWITLNTIYFVADLEQSFAELRRVLRMGGVGVLGMADSGWMAGQPFTAGHFTLRPVADVVATLEGAGFSVEVRIAPGNGTGHRLLLCRPARPARQKQEARSPAR